MNVNEIVGYEVINSRTAASLGTVIDVVFDKKLKKAKSLLVAEQETEYEKTLPIKSITLSEDCVLTTRSTLLEYVPNSQINVGIIGKKTICPSSGYTDKIKNVVFDLNAVTEIITNGGTFAPDLINKIGATVVLLKDNVPERKTEEDITKTPPRTQPEFKRGSFDFLLSMRTKTNLYDYSGGLIIPS